MVLEILTRLHSRPCSGLFVREPEGEMAKWEGTNLPSDSDPCSSCPLLKDDSKGIRSSLHAFSQNVLFCIYLYF